MREEDINGRKIFHQLYNLRLREHVRPALVSKTATESAKFHPSDFVDGEVHVANPLRKWNISVVVAAHRQDFLRATPVGHLEDYGIR